MPGIHLFDKSPMLVNVKVTAVRYCPIYRLSVVILKNHERRLWLPVFVHKFWARRIKALLSSLEGHERTFSTSEFHVDSIILNGIRGHPFLAAVTVRNGISSRTTLKPYEGAVLLSLKTGAPLRIDDEIMLEIPESRRDGDYPLADVVLPDKKDLGVRSSKEVLQKELEHAVENEEYERATVLRQILVLLGEDDE